MSAAGLLSEGPIGTAAARWPAGGLIADASLSVLIFLGAFVLIEPAPYDLALVGVIVVWAAFGLRLQRAFLPMTTLMLLYVAGGFLSLTQVPSALGKPLLYVVVTGFLAASSIFIAAIVSEKPERRLRIIANAYIASAVVTSLIGILAYFNAIPGADMFKLYDRAKGTFQDPNVFGPFLVLPLGLLARDILTRPLVRSIPAVAAFLVILLAIFLSFSRAAWGMSVGVLLIVAFLAYITDPSPKARLRIVARVGAGAAAVMLLLAAALSVPAIRDLYEVRAQVVQEYDDSRTGRFERHIEGFFLIQEKPAGVGPFEFSKRFGEDEHNTWLKGFTVYGWMGGFAYIILALWTLAAAFPLLFKPRPWQPIVQVTYAVFVGHLLIHNVIDNDHWRHLFLIYGMLWGAIGAESLRRRGARQAAAPATRAQNPAENRGIAPLRPSPIERASGALRRQRTTPIVPRASERGAAW